MLEPKYDIRKSQLASTIKHSTTTGQPPKIHHSINTNPTSSFNHPMTSLSPELSTTPRYKLPTQGKIVAVDFVAPSLTIRSRDFDSNFIIYVARSEITRLLRGVRDDNQPIRTTFTAVREGDTMEIEKRTIQLRAPPYIPGPPQTSDREVMETS